MASPRPPGRRMSFEKSFAKKMRKPHVTAVIVSDHRKPDVLLRDELRTLRSFANQDYQGRLDLVLVEDRRREPAFQRDLSDRFENLQIIFGDATTSHELKNLGVTQARGEFVALFEADSEPKPCCISLMVDALSTRPEFGAVSARTLYRGSDAGSLARALTFLGRGTLEPVELTENNFLSNNAALLRNQVAKRFPYPSGGSAFVTAEKRNRRMRQAGVRFLMEPAAVVIHEFEGLGFELEYRRQKGYQRMERRNRKSLSSVPALAARSGLNLAQHVRRRGAKELKAGDFAVALVASLILPILEIPGMIDSIRGLPTTGRRFR